MDRVPLPLGPASRLVSSRLVMVLLVVMTVGSLGGCGGEEGAKAPMPIGALVVTRSGGIAGFHDTLRIATDGSATVTRPEGSSMPCRVDASSLARLRAIRLAAVDPVSPSSSAGGHVVADGLTWSVRSTAGRATVSEGQSGGLRRELIAAAAAVFASCRVARP